MKKFKIIWRRVYPRRNRAAYLKYKEVARQLAKNRLAHYNAVYGFTVNRIAIKDSRSRWGSCSKKGNLNFSYKIALLPLDMADYVIVHELCHLGEFNHSQKFWDLVAQTVPNYKEIKNKFKQPIHV